MKQIYTFITILILFQACSSINGVKRPLRVESVPSDCEVYSADGKFIGRTPLDIKPEDIAAYRDNNHLQLVFRKPEYIDTNLIVDLNSVGSYKIKLSELNERHYSKWVMSAYAPKTNRMVRELMEIQGLLFARNNDLAKTKIDKFIQIHSTIAAPHTIRGSLALTEGKVEEAKVYVKRALQIDGEDMTARELLQRIERMDAQ